MIVTCREMQELEERAFAQGSSAEELMEIAGREIAAAVCRFCLAPGECRVVYGKGHNGGDALVAARYLLETGWRIVLEEIFPADQLAPLTARHLEALRHRLHPESELLPGGPVIVLDGLLGIGAEVKALRPPVREAAARINRWREEEGAVVFAIDLPTGLCGNSGRPLPDAVEADYTLTIGFAKAGLVTDEAINHVGRLVLLELPPLTELAPEPPSPSDEWPTLATPAALRPLLPRRRFDTHKGDCGRVGVIAGSRGLAGAAVMASEAVVRGGAGLVTLFVKDDFYPIIAPMVRPEVMTRPVASYRAILDYPLDALVIGPGLGMEGDPDEILAVLENCSAPAVVDADALNLLASTPGRLETLMRCAGPRLLTPHPGEMRRLHPRSLSLSRREAAHEFLKQFRGSREPVTLLLKGARTLIAEEPPGRNLRLCYNTSGTPGMASGGMGDVLTGLLAALLAQGMEPFDAARLGAWLAGRSAELALTHGWQSQESLAATDLTDFFGAAFKELR